MILAELTTYLAANGIGTTGTDLFYGPLQEQYPDVVTLVNVYGGSPDEPAMGDPIAAPGKSARLEFQHVQLLFRGAANDTDGPLTRALSARDAMLKVLSSTLSGTYYLAIEPLQDPFFLSMDKNYRLSYVFNARCTKEPS